MKEDKVRIKINQEWREFSLGSEITPTMTLSYLLRENGVHRTQGCL